VIDHGKLPAVRLGPTGRRVRILRSDLDALLAASYRAAPATGQPPTSAPATTGF
jgi:hypothetical protein